MSKTVQPKTEKKKETNKIDQSNTDYIIFMAACLFLSSLLQFYGIGKLSTTKINRMFFNR